MNKFDLIQRIIGRLAGEMDRYANAAQFSRAEATDEQSRSEHKYDTRGLEASYLARGQSRQAAEMEAAIKEFEKLGAKEFSANDGIDLGAFVELKSKGEHAFYFLGPKAGGTEIEWDGKEVMVITPQSPLGEELLGKKAGEKFKRSGPNQPEYKIAQVL